MTFCATLLWYLPPPVWTLPFAFWRGSMMAYDNTLFPPGCSAHFRCFSLQRHPFLPARILCTHLAAAATTTNILLPDSLSSATATVPTRGRRSTLPSLPTSGTLLPPPRTPLLPAIVILPVCHSLLYLTATYSQHSIYTFPSAACRLLWAYPQFSLCR